MVRSAAALALSKCSECQNQQGFGYSLGKKKHCLGEEPQWQWQKLWPRRRSAEKKWMATQEDTSRSVAPLRRQRCWDHLWWLVILKLWKYSCSFPTRKQTPERLRSFWVVIPISVWCCPATEDGGRIWMSLGSEMTSQDKWAVHSKVKSLKLGVGLTSMDWVISEQSSLLVSWFNYSLDYYLRGCHITQKGIFFFCQEKSFFQ